MNILVPSSWYEFDIHPATRDESIREVVRERVRERPELADSRTALIRTLTRTADEAWQTGVLYFGALADLSDEAPLTASLTIAVLEADDRADDGPDGNLAALVAALKPVAAGRRPTDPWRRIKLVELPDAGSAARSEGIDDIELPDDDRMVRMVLMQTFVPFPGGDPRVAVISGATSQLALAEPMLELFDGITETFRFVYADDDPSAGSAGRVS
ncbi:hypothetical protein [Streptomyces sp. CBMA29]|uniref:hypothetical protein n=1 Tax=Streptomyces sp. CBMA29 TaxID=1896314 RepID=UPI0016621A58|nr:hypothetical protein [Streptomyces sp. CBMA29]